MSVESGAEPETKNSRRPPKSARTFWNTRRSARARCAASTGPGLFPARSRREASRPTPSAHRKIVRLHRPALPGVREHLRVDLLEDPGDRADEGRPDRGEVLDDLVDAPVHRGREADPQLGGPDHLPEDVGEGEPEELEGVRVLRGTRSRRSPRLRQPRPVRELDALRAPGRAGGVDERRERRRCGSRRRAPRTRPGGPRPRPGPPPRAPSGSGPSRRRCRSPSKTTTCRSAGSSARCAASFRTCSSFSTNATAAPESDRMKAHSSAVRRRVDGARRAAGEQDPEVRQDPLDPGRGQDRAGLLRRQAEGAKPPRQRAHARLGLVPGERAPPAGVRIPERLGVRGPAHPV